MKLFYIILELDEEQRIDKLELDFILWYYLMQIEGRVIQCRVLSIFVRELINSCMYQ